MSEVHDREREAREEVIDQMYAFAENDVAYMDAALDAYRDAVEARVRWDQQADAEGYNIGPNIPGGAS